MSALPYRWDGEVMRPLSGFGRRADSTFVVGMVYHMEPVEERSAKSHRFYFSCINQAWESLPDDLARLYPSATHLRKFALIKAGFADSRQIVAASKAEARRLAAFIRPMDEYAVVSVLEAVVTVWTAQSQSLRAMGKERFKFSKDAVLAEIETMLDLEPGTLGQQKEAA